jgi:hypothetical protein
MAKLTNEIIEGAIYGFESRKKIFDDQIAELRGTLAGASAESDGEPSLRRPRRRMSAAGRKAIGEAQRKDGLPVRIRKRQRMWNRLTARQNDGNTGFSLRRRGAT